MSKRLRFEIFKRDGFRCLYCGATPVQKTLHVDHVVAVVDGGTDDPANLVTACPDCNLGKGAVPLERKKFVVTIATEAEQDHAEQILEYLRIQRGIDDAKNAAMDALADHWEVIIGPMTEMMCNRLKLLMVEWSHEKLIEAMEITARKMGTPGAEFDASRAVQQAQYFHGILRKWRTPSGGT